MRARIKKQISEEEISKIKDVELNEVGYKYFIEHKSMLDIAFEKNVSERTIQRRVKEIYLQSKK